MLTPPTQHQIVAQINEVRFSLRMEGLVRQTKFDLAGSHFLPAPPCHELTPATHNECLMDVTEECM